MTDLDIALHLAGRRVVVVGGGRIGLRRVRRFLAAGARVRVVSPQLADELAALVAAGQVEWLAREYVDAADLDDAWLVHTATGLPLVDARVAADAESLRIFCVNAGNADRGTAQVLASREVSAPGGGSVRVAVHGGRDAARARAMVEGIAADLGEGRHDIRPRRTVRAA